MAVSVVVTDRKVYNQYGNGLDFAINPADYTTYLKGGVMGVQKVVYTVAVTWLDSYGSTDGDEWAVNGNILTRQVGSWITEGFSIGDTIDLTLESGLIPTVIFTDRVITNITDTLIFFDGASVAPISGSLFGTIHGGKTDLKGLEYSFGIVENNAVIDEYKYILDNSDQTYYADNVGDGPPRSTSFVAMKSKTESIQSWDSSREGNTKVRFISRPSVYIQEFEIEHEYIINPYILPQLLEGNKSYKYISHFDFRQNVNNVNTSKTQVDQLQLGSVGDFDENHNGYVNDFNISDLVYTDVASASTVTKLNIKAKTRVEFSVNSTSGLFNTTDPVIGLHSFIPNANQYSKQPDKFRDVWVFESVYNNIDSAFTNNGIFTRFEAALVSANKIDVIIEVELSPSEQERINEDDNYRLAIEVGDGDTANQTQNVTLLIDENTYTKDSNITDLIIDVPAEGGFAPTYKFLSPANELFTTIFGWIEDDNKSIRRFGVNRSISKDAEILGGRFKIVAYENATGETFNLQSEELDLSGQITAPIGVIDNSTFPVQLITDSRTRGYNLPLGEEANLLLFETDTNDATYQYYEWRIGFKMNWQTWVSLPNADAIFIDVSEPFRNLNNRASNYSLKEGWSIRCQWQFDMQGLDDDGIIGETEYNFFTDQFSIFDFGEQDNDPTTWTCVGETYDKYGNLLSQVIDWDNDEFTILTDEETFVKAIFTPQAPYVISSINPYWGAIRIAEKNQQGFNVDVLNTTKPYPSNNRLIPLDGETQTKITLVSNTIVIECRTNLSEIKSNVDYKLSVRLANQNEPISPFVWTFKTQKDVPTDGTFQPSMSSIAGEVPTWTFIDGHAEVTTLNPNPAKPPLSVNELNGTCQDVDVTFSTNDPSNITEVYLRDQYLCEILDMSLLTGCASYNIGGLAAGRNFFTSVVFASLDVNITFFACNWVATINELDFTPIGSKFGGTVQAVLCTGLNSVIFPTSDLAISSLTFYSNNINTAVNLSVLTKLGGEIRFDGNNIPSISFPSSSQFINRINIANNSLITVFDISGLSGVNGNVKGDNCALTSILFNAGTRFGTGAAGFNGFTVANNNLAAIDFSVITTLNTGTDLDCSSNVLNAANCQTIIDDLNTIGASSGVLDLQTQTPVLTGGEIATIQATANYINLTTVLSWTVSL